MTLNSILFFFIGIILSPFFINIGYRLPVDKNIFSKSKCDNCNHELSFIEKIPVLSYFLCKGRCKNCHQKISILYLLFELGTGIIFSLAYTVFIKESYPYIKLAIGLLFLSSLIVITLGDIKYMLIPDELLIVSSVILMALKVYLGFKNEELTNMIDAGYLIIFMLIDAVVMFVIMYIIKKMGDMIFKKESLGGGDVKMMCLIAIMMGYKMSIIVIFIASFIALPISIYNAYRKSEAMLPFGPYLAAATVILYLCQIDFNMVLDFIH
ncbi:MAG: prepilin peptidase [Bacilli bacterium]|nr:prepilin peptidase [Bacilli bacterium]